MERGLLVINSGSSSIKFSIYRLDGALTAVCRGQVENLGGPARFSADPEGLITVRPRGERRYGHGEALADLLQSLNGSPELPDIAAVGHRVVHGGPRYDTPLRITPARLLELERLVPLAPLHQPHNLAAVRALAAAQPELPQVACFDTAFHRGQPPLARLYGLPRRFWEQGIQRYGFHGLSYEYIASRLPVLLGERAGGRIVVAHLGNGASLCALRDLKSVASTMGFTALEGLPMGTRCGALDPGVVLYLMEEQGLGVAEVTDLLYKRSGLLGLSGESHDMRRLLSSTGPGARLAVDYFVYRIGRELGSLAAALGGLDGLVFTGGIGEHAAPIRARVAEQAAWLGVAVDPAANAQSGDRDISAPGSRVAAWVVATDEERVIARHTRRLVGL